MYLYFCMHVFKCHWLIFVIHLFISDHTNKVEKILNPVMCSYWHTGTNTTSWSAYSFKLLYSLRICQYFSGSGTSLILGRYPSLLINTIILFLLHRLSPAAENEKYVRFTEIIYMPKLIHWQTWHEDVNMLSYNCYICIYIVYNKYI